MSVQRVPIPPISPDFSHCSTQYGTNILGQNCIVAIDQLPSGEGLQTYTIGGNGLYGIPLSRSFGSCTVTLEIAGPTTPPQGTGVRINPTVIDDAAGWILQSCVNRAGGIGGFVTGNFVEMLNYVTRPNLDLAAPFPRESGFFTVTISGRGIKQGPGDFDPIVPLHMYVAQRDANGDRPKASTDPFYQAFEAMSTGLSDGTFPRPWWTFLSKSLTSSEEMAYECNSGLGSPNEVDCDLLEYSELGAPSDTITVGPDTPRIVSSNTCIVNISASSNIVLTWGAIGAVVAVLVGMCIADPVAGASGGTAQYSAPPASTRRKRQSSVSGLNALPPGVTVTLYSPGHFHP